LITTTSLYFVSSNKNKFVEVEKILEREKEKNKDKVKRSLKILFSKVIIKEIQSESIIEVAEDKVKKAFDIIKSPVIVEDDGLFIDDLNGFPGIYSSFVYKTIGNKGILNLLKGREKVKRSASFLSIFSFFDGKIMESFSGETIGHITTKISPEGWGFDPIFKPENEDKTYGQINILRKNEISHRAKSLRNFLGWYNQKY
jgi:XTP/dITP diphosphohydrolase